MSKSDSDAINILLIEDNPWDALLIEEMLSENNQHRFSSQHVSTLADGLQALDGTSFDTVLLDLGLPDSYGIGAIQQVRKRAPKIAIIMLTGLDDEKTAVSALHQGAQDYLVKGQTDSRLLARTLRYALERKRIEDELKESRHFIKQIADTIPSILYIFDTVSQRLVYTNRALSTLLGYKEKDLQAMRETEYEELFHPHDLPRIHEFIEILLSEKDIGVLELDVRVRHKSGYWRWFRNRNISFSQNTSGGTRQVLGTAKDITDRKQMEETIKHQAQHDLLTGLPNRMLFMDHLKQSLARAARSRQPVAILYLDLDNFKTVNDSLGHSAGDHLLREVALRIKSCLRESDIVSRIGGDEFTILLPTLTHEEDAGTIADKITEAFQSPFIINGRSLGTTFSIGISLYPTDGSDEQVLLQHADVAMYRAKESGRNHYRFYHPSMNTKAMARISTERLLRKSIERNELEVHYQPQISLGSGGIICAEALVRWRHPEKGLIHPRDFISFAEGTGFITAIDEWVFSTACRQNNTWREDGLPPIKISVNFSSRHFRKVGFVETVSRIIHETGGDPSSLGIEITETADILAIDSTLSQFKSLSAMGLTLFIDDFGKGNMPISYLKKWPVHALKIDNSFIANLTADPDCKSIIKTIIVMAHNLNLTVVAEGVETEDQKAFLDSTGCDFMQGYYTGKPQPALEFTEFLGNYNNSAL